MTSWGLQVWGLRPTTLHGHWLCDSLSCQMRESGLKQMLSGELLVRSVLQTAPVWAPQLDHIHSLGSNYLFMR